MDVSNNVFCKVPSGGNLTNFKAFYKKKKKLKNPIKLINVKKKDDNLGKFIFLSDIK